MSSAYQRLKKQEPHFIPFFFWFGRMAFDLNLGCKDGLSRMELSEFIHLHFRLTDHQKIVAEYLILKYERAKPLSRYTYTCIILMVLYVNFDMNM